MSQMSAPAPAATPTPPAAPVSPAPASAPAPSPAGASASSTTIPSAFLKTPVRPGQRAAQGTPQPAPNQAPPVHNTSMLPPFGGHSGHHPVVPTSPQPAQIQPQSQTQSQPPLPPQQPTPPPTGAENGGVQDPYLMQRFQVMEAERQELQQRNAQMQQALNQLLQERQTMLQYQQEQNFDKLFSDEDLAKLESLDPGDARYLGKTMMQAASGQMQAMQQQFQQQTTAMQNLLRQQQEMIQQMQIRQLTGDVLREHPDFYQLQETPEFKAFMAQRDGLASKTRDQIAAEEFLAGNTAYVIDLVKQYKAGRPNPQQVLAVPPVQSPVNGMTNMQPAQPQYSLADLNRLMRQHLITPEQYSAELSKLRQAEQAAPAPVAANFF